MTLEERIQRLEDIHACEQLQYKYEYYLDHGYQGEGIASLFTVDGLWAAAARPKVMKPSKLMQPA